MRVRTSALDHVPFNHAVAIMAMLQDYGATLWTWELPAGKALRASRGTNDVELGPLFWIPIMQPSSYVWFAVQIPVLNQLPILERYVTMEAVKTMGTTARCANLIRLFF